MARLANNVLGALAVAFVLGVMALPVGLIGFTVVDMVKTTHARQLCLVHGYPQVQKVFPFRYFCVRREDQTDKVVPADSVE